MKDGRGHGSNPRATGPGGPAPRSASSDVYGGNGAALASSGARVSFTSSGGVPFSSNAEAANALMGSLRSTQAPIHPSMLLRSNREE
jgi:hypothetical protein